MHAYLRAVLAYVRLRVCVCVYLLTCTYVYVCVCMCVSDAKSFGKRDCAVVARGRGKVPRGKRDGTRGEEEIG